MNFKEYVNAIKDSIDVKELLAFLNRRVNRHGMTNCIAPDHEDKNPSMWAGKTSCGCYACGYHGDCFDIVQTVKGCSFMEALCFCAELSGLPRFEFQKQSEAEIEAYQALKKREDQVTKILEAAVRIYRENKHPYLLERGISPCTDKSIDT